MESEDTNYDYDSTIFSPDGRLFQVEYAREAIKKGATTLGLKFKNGVLLMTYKDFSSKLIEKSSNNKIAQIDDHIICAYVGLSADARHLFNYGQDLAAINRIWYDELINVKELVHEICRYKHLFTTYNGLRPFGLILLVAGVDGKGLHLFDTDPSGSFFEYKAICEGQNDDVIMQYFNKHYKDDFRLDKAIKLGTDSIKKSIDKKFEATDLEIGIIEKNTDFYKLSKKEIDKII
jgi:proteasome alpha subunit